MADVAVSPVESALKNIEKIVEIGGYMKKEVMDELLKAVSEIREYLELIHRKTESDSDENRGIQSEASHNQQNRLNEENDSSTMEQLATSVGGSSPGRSESQPAAPKCGE